MVKEVRVEEAGKQIILDFPSLGDAMMLWKPWGDGESRTQVTKLLHQALTAAGLSLQVQVNGKPVALLGGEEMTGLMLSLLARRLAAS